VADPWVNALHRFIGSTRRRTPPAAAGVYEKIQEKALAQGPSQLSPQEQKRLLRNPESLHRLHERVWEISDDKHSEEWGLP